METVMLVSFGSFTVHVYFSGTDESNPYKICEARPTGDGEIEMTYIDEYADLFSCLCWVKDRGADVGEVRTAH